MALDTKAFRRNPDGSWVCVAPVTLDGPRGRLQVVPGTLFTPGTFYLGIDMVLLLESQREGGPSGRRTQ